MRGFPALGEGLHERLLFSTVKKPHSTCIIFDRKRMMEPEGVDEVRVLVMWEEEYHSMEAGHTLNEILHDDCDEDLAVHVALAKVNRVNNYDWQDLQPWVWSIAIPDTVEELCDDCFYDWEALTRVTFSEASLLKRIGVGAFYDCGLAEIHIPGGVEELCDECFAGCEVLARATFGEPSSLKRIGVDAFNGCALTEIAIPDSVEELCDMCFSQCKSLTCVTFGEASSLKVIGVCCFSGSGIVQISLPASVISIGGSAFAECPLKEFVIRDNSPFSIINGLVLSNDQHTCHSCIGKIQEIYLPDCVEDLCDKCFCGCWNLSYLMFGECSSLKRIGIEAFYGCGLEEIYIPNAVEDIREKCFYECKNLSRVTFGESSSLKRIGVDAFSICGLTTVHIPDSVEMLCDECFFGCPDLSHVTFGESSSLKRLGVEAFYGCGLRDIHVPDSVEEV